MSAGCSGCPGCTAGSHAACPETLDKLPVGKDAIIDSVRCAETSLRKHILDMGLTPGTEVTLVKCAPMGDPLELRLRGYELTLRKADAAHIYLRGVHDAHNAPRPNPHAPATPHPGKVRRVRIARVGRNAPLRQMRRSISRWRAIRIAAKPRCSINLLGRISTWVTSPGLPSGARTA